jgi:hypothetical protein
VFSRVVGAHTMSSSIVLGRGAHCRDSVGFSKMDVQIAFQAHDNAPSYYLPKWVTLKLRYSNIKLLILQSAPGIIKLLSANNTCLGDNTANIVTFFRFILLNFLIYLWCPILPVTHLLSSTRTGKWREWDRHTGGSHSTGTKNHSRSGGIARAASA